MEVAWGKGLELREQELTIVAELATKLGWEILQSRCKNAELISERLSAATADKIIFQHGLEDPDCDLCLSWDLRILPALDGDESLQDNACKMHANGKIYLSYKVDDAKKAEDIYAKLRKSEDTRLADRTDKQKFYFDVESVQAPKQYRKLSDTKSTLRTHFSIQEEEWSSLRRFFLQRECRRIGKFKQMFVKHDTEHGFGELDFGEFTEMMKDMNLSVPLVEGDLKSMYNDINESAKESASASSDTDDISFEELIHWLDKPAGQLFEIEMDRQSEILGWA